MKISTVKAVLTEKDIINIMKEYIKIEGLSFEKIKISELIILEGTYKKGINIPFKVRLGIGSIRGNIVNIKILNISVAKIGILKRIKNFTLKKVLKEFSEYGIQVDKDNIKLDLSLVSKFIPYVYFKLRSIKIMNGFIEAEVEDLMYSENKKKVNKDTEKRSNQGMCKDSYYNFRNELNKKVSNKYENVMKYAMVVPDIVALLWRIFKDKRVGIKTKIKAMAVIGYLAMPFDILPDFIPFIGRIDDIAVAFYGLNMIMSEVSQEVILENWAGEEDIIIIIKEGVKYISEVVGSENIAKLIYAIKGILEGSKKLKKDDQVEETNMGKKKKYNERKVVIQNY
ncbi:YkvA family protein [Clostridium rectalis]|uniref:YkvA family protein n=1 Tax=Clostridium rectalis TaxID=2040295 RepID=UPI000F63495F|nr:YkvA family protein [Clostridium rectalis]